MVGFGLTGRKGWKNGDHDLRDPYAEGSHEWHAWGLGFTIPRMRAWAHLDVAEIMGFAPWDFTLSERNEIFSAWDNGRDAWAKGWR